MAWSAARAGAGGFVHPKKVHRILTQHGYVCHLCGHGGATELDHIVPWAEWSRTDLSVHDASNLAPAHAQPCAECGRDCHADKTKAEAARGRARHNREQAARRVRPTEKHPGAL